MEAPLAKCLEEVVETGAVGIICADRHGLALHSSGPVQLKSAGVIATLASLAKEIDPSCDTTPTIHLESDSLDIMIQQKELVTLLHFANGVLGRHVVVQVEEKAGGDYAQSLDQGVDVNDDEALLEESLLLPTEGKANNGDVLASEEELLATPVTKEPPAAAKISLEAGSLGAQSTGVAAPAATPQKTVVTPTAKEPASTESEAKKVRLKTSDCDRWR
ncbi:hypothetical protein HPB52_017305 [Rhipicephalus sanguineus]|uniref:Late endosomal/lysosomal adaptor and MAPK and MTOR activator 5 n=1 Tax=Rhipicephalus sanguineus TaxID=34632 RepID=A0A9D4Q1G1_RHISA|nr:hypothetical protein HPB52_017305 [Rhipicephalus sanguineus]